LPWYSPREDSSIVRRTSLTPELEKEVIIGIATAVFTGVPTAALFWWTWRRDQERLIVQKLVFHVKSISGGRVLERDRFGPKFGILIRNLSLFSLHVSAVGFKIDGEVFELDNPIFPVRLKQNPDQESKLALIKTEPSREIPSQSSTHIDVDFSDRNKIGEMLQAAASKRGISVDELVMSPRVSALVVAETKKKFSSNTFWLLVKFHLKNALAAPE
jgi:hypothetical protein